MAKKERPLPIPLTEEQKAFIDEWYWKFLTEKGSRGVKLLGNAQKWTTDEFIPKFMDEYYDEMDKEERKEFIPRADYTIYTYYSNMWKRDPHKDIGICQEPGKICPEYLWACVNAKVVGEAITEHRNKHPEKPIVAAHRTVVCKMFKDLPDDEQAQWKERAETGRQLKIVASTEPLEGEARVKHARNGMSKINAILKDMDQRSGVLGVVHLAMEKEGHGPNALVINTLTSPSVKDFNDGANQFAEYITDNLHKRVDGAQPRAAVIPGKDGRPVIPDLTVTPVLKHARRMVRTAGSAYWQFAGGQPPVPWTVISKHLAAGNYTWISKERMPEPLPSGNPPRFGDPTDMGLPDCMAWLGVFSLYQEGAPHDKCFQFDQVLASTSHEWPSWAVAVSKEKVRRSNTDAILVKYDRFVERPQRTTPVCYPTDSWEFVYYSRNGSVSELWNGLPAGRVQQVLVVIPDSESKVYVGWFQNLSADDEHMLSLVRKSIEKVNEMDTLLPLIADNQLWSKDDSSTHVPQLLPQTPPSADRIVGFASDASFWLHRSYFGPADEALPYATVQQVEVWQKKMRTNGIYHPKSQTFMGGKWGVGWVIRALILVLANAAAACGKLKPPVPAPGGYDLERFGPADVKRALSWLTDWVDLLEKACDILRSSYDERVQPPGSSAEDPSSLSDKSGDKETTFDPDFDHATSLTPHGLAQGLSKLAARAKSSRKSKAGPSFSAIDQESGDEDEDEDDANQGWNKGDTSSDCEEDRSRSKGKSSSSKAKGKSTPRPKQKPKPSPSAASHPKAKPPVDYLKVPNREEVVFADRQAVFGPQVQPAPTAPLQHLLDAVTTEGTRFLRRCSIAMNEYLEEHTSAKIQYPDRMKLQVQQRVANVDDERRPLLACILLHRAGWLKAERQWKAGSENHRDFWQILRRGSHILLALQQMAPSYMDEPEFVEMLNKKKDFEVYTWIARCAFEQFATAAQLSVTWANRLEDGWESIPDDAPLDRVKSLVAEIRDWRDDHAALRVHHRDFRRQVWAKYDVEEYLEGWKDCWYSYGNPWKDVMSSEAEELVKDIPVSFSIFGDIKEKVSGLSQEALSGVEGAANSSVDASVPQQSESGSRVEGAEITPTQNTPESEPNHGTTVPAAQAPAGESKKKALDAGTVGEALVEPSAQDVALPNAATTAPPPASSPQEDLPAPQIVVAPSHIPSYTAHQLVADAEAGSNDRPASSAPDSFATAAEETADEDEQGQEGQTAPKKSSKKDGGRKGSNVGTGGVKRGAVARVRGGIVRGKGVTARGGKGGVTRTWSQRKGETSPQDTQQEGSSEAGEPKRQKTERKPVVRG